MVTLTGDCLIVGFLKVRNEIIREGNIYRCLHNMNEFCDDIFVVDDSSYDGTYEYLKTQLPEDHIIRVPPDKQDFAKELYWKQQLLDLIHKNGPWKYIWWQDADEVLDKSGVENIREFCRANLSSNIEAWTFHYLQLWRNLSYYRLDDGFNDGWFLKLWRYRPELCFDIQEGTHHPQFPLQIYQALQANRVAKTPYEIIHYGNYGCNLRFKAIQYHNGLGGVDRHLRFGTSASYALINPDSFPSGAERASAPEPVPQPFTSQQVELTLRMRDLKNIEGQFCITISTRNRGYTLRRAIDSILAQTYDKWILVVVDDGSTDDTSEILHEYMEKDPRIFYVRFLEQRGGVAVNEVACDIAVNTSEYWVRLGSDDWLLPRKLEYDVEAFKAHDALYGPFIDHYMGKFETLGNLPVRPEIMKPIFEQGGFFASWANFAVKTKILKKIKEKYGNYCHPSLMNMEDCLQNYRICKETPWIFRGVYNGNLIINPDETMCMEIHNNRDNLEPDGIWNKNPDGASANSEIYARDRALTTQLILQEKDK